MAKRIGLHEKIERLFDPRKDTGAIRPITARIAVGDVNDKYSEYPSSNLNPRRLAAIFREANEGNVRSQMELFEEMEEKDTHLFSQLQTRKLAITGLDWEVQPFSEDDIDKQVAEFVAEQLKALDDFEEIMTDMLDAIGKGISIMELDWGVNAKGQNIIKDIEYIHPKKLIWDSMSDEMKICTKEFPTGISLPENKFVLHQYKAKSGHPSRSGVLRIVAWMYLFKNYNVKDWVSFCEVFGMPLRLGKYDASASDDDKRQLMDAIVSLGTDAAGIVPTSTMIEFIESNKTTSADIYEKFARYCDEQISKAVLGQTLTSDSGNGGSYAQSKTHNEVRGDLIVADAKSLAVTIRRCIIRPLVEYNFGTSVELPFFIFDVEETEDQKQLVEIYKTLACDMGLEIPKAHVYKKFNIPKPEDADEVLSPRPRQERERTEAYSLKDDSLTEGKAEQKQLDDIVAIANKQSDDIFEDMMKPILELIDESDDLETLQMKLSKEDELKALYDKMNKTELQDMLQQGIYLASLIGRSME